MGKFRSLAMPDVGDVHDGYFAETNEGRCARTRGPTPRTPPTRSSGSCRRKEELLGFDEPLRFIFSHSALAEGWDNPNVFTICNLQDGKSTMRKRQQVGRGLRLPVMENGERCHVDEINLLTVIAKESFATFAGALQKEIEEETGVTFTGRIINVREKKTVELKEKVLESSGVPASSGSASRRAPRTSSTSRPTRWSPRRYDGSTPCPQLEPVKFRISRTSWRWAPRRSGARTPGAVARTWQPASARSLTSWVSSAVGCRSLVPPIVRILK